MNRATGYRAQRGQAVIFVTLSLVVSFGMLGFVVDIGWAHFRSEACRTAAQAAATAAAVAASQANGFSCISGDTVAPCRTDWACPNSPANPPGDSLEGGCLYAGQNGFSNANPRQSVVMSSGNSGSPAPGTSPSYWVSATVSESLPQLFSAVLGNSWATVRAKAVTGVFLQPKGACIYALDQTASPAIGTVGGANVDATCGIYDDSSASKALEVKGTATITATTANIVGNYATSGGGTFSVPPADLTTGANVTPDPFSSIPAPNYPNRCDSPSGIHGAFHASMPSDGFYVICGSVTLTGNATQTFAPGMYIVKDGGITWNTGNVSGAGVTFFLTGSGYSGVSIAGNVNVTLSAPSTGLYRGLIFYQDRSLTNPPASSFTGGSGQILDGSLYFPTSNVTYTGGSAFTASYTGLVADTITFAGNSYFSADTSGVHTGLGLPLIGMMQ